jgi:hypothetical protein
MNIARVFTRKTHASPDDPLAFFGMPPDPFPEVDAVHISVTFTWDLWLADMLAEAWGRVAPVQVGGPATGRHIDSMPSNAMDCPPIPIRTASIG